MNSRMMASQFEDYEYTNSYRDPLLSQMIQLSIDARTLERLIRDQQIKLEDIHCQDCDSHRMMQRLLLNTLKADIGPGV